MTIADQLLLEPEDESFGGTPLNLTCGHPNLVRSFHQEEAHRRDERREGSRSARPKVVPTSKSRASTAPSSSVT